VVLDHHSPALHLIQQIRDEAHRFAVTFHRARRGNRELISELLNISGIGEKTARKLLSQFGSLETVRNLSSEELGQVVNPSQARQIFEYFASTKRAS
jgi:excinuclease ABC subunit C